jgi:hypothetical protein
MGLFLEEKENDKKATKELTNYIISLIITKLFFAL